LSFDIEELSRREIGRHPYPYSPLLTVVTQICLADIWQRWRYKSDVVVGHQM
jgi:hypothetical protein